MSDTLTIPQAIAAFQRGEMLIMMDDEGRENEGDLIIPAVHADAEVINFMVTHGRGLVCLPMLETAFDRLNLPMMVAKNQSPYGTAFGVSFEAASGVSTGISAADRARSIAVAVDPNSGPSDIAMPGHMFPLKAVDGGVLVRPGHTEGSTDLARLAGFDASAVLCEIMNSDGSMARREDLLAFAKEHGLGMVTIADLVAWRKAYDPIAVCDSGCAHPKASLPLHGLGDFTIHSFKNKAGGAEHLALVSEKVNNESPCLVRMHSECITGDVFGSMRCDCGEQLNEAMRRISEEGGVLIYLRQEGRGIGLHNKIKAYALQEQGLDTVEANERLGFLADAREYTTAASILNALSIDSIRLLTNNTRKVEALRAAGIDVLERVPLVMPSNPNNVAYLKTKQEKLGHVFEGVAQ